MNEPTDEEIYEAASLIPNWMKDVLPALAAGDSDAVLSIFRRCPEECREMSNISMLAEDLKIMELMGVAQSLGKNSWTMTHLHPKDGVTWHTGRLNSNETFLIVEINNRKVVSASPVAIWESAPKSLDPEIKAEVERFLGRLM